MSWICKTGGRHCRRIKPAGRSGFAEQAHTQWQQRLLGGERLLRRPPIGVGSFVVANPSCAVRLRFPNADRGRCLTRVLAQQGFGHLLRRKAGGRERIGRRWRAEKSRRLQQTRRAERIRGVEQAGEAIASFAVHRNV